jgi:hypothetical protein
MTYALGTTTTTCGLSLSRGGVETAVFQTNTSHLEYNATLVPD